MKGAIAVLVILGLVLGTAWWTVDVAATRPHPAIVEELLHETMEHAVRRSAAAIVAPPLDEAALVTDGADHYFAMCEGCHAGPGVEPSELAQGLYPPPPPLHEEEEWSDAELFWITKHGIKASGMPGYGPTHSDEALWAIVAFVRTLPGMTPAAYEPFRPAAGSGHDHGAHGHAHGGHEHGSSDPGADPAGAVADEHDHHHGHDDHDHGEHAH